MIFEVAYRSNFDLLKISINNNIVFDDTQVSKFITDIDLPASIKIEFRPYKIQPIVRLDNFMLNYWLANISLYDHMIEFTANADFFSEYRNKDIEGMLVPTDDEKNEHYYDKYIGLNNMHIDLVNKIKEQLR